LEEPKGGQVTTQANINKFFKSSGVVGAPCERKEKDKEEALQHESEIDSEKKFFEGSESGRSEVVAVGVDDVAAEAVDAEESHTEAMVDLGVDAGGVEQERVDGERVEQEQGVDSDRGDVSVTGGEEPEIAEQTQEEKQPETPVQTQDEILDISVPERKQEEGDVRDLEQQKIADDEAMQQQEVLVDGGDVPACAECPHKAEASASTSLHRDDGGDGQDGIDALSDADSTSSAESDGAEGSGPPGPDSQHSRDAPTLRSLHSSPTEAPWACSEISSPNIAPDTSSWTCFF
jgi:hypothetical protein